MSSPVIPEPDAEGVVDLEPASYQVRDLWIPMPDGVQLHARAWMPFDIDHRPAPVLLEYLPYRLDDWTSVRDAERHPFYAAHGYVSVRVDIRGTGSSQGHFVDEYSEAELEDGEEVVRWLASQPWSTGRIGMFGISWGGFNSLQLAERGVEELRAIVTVCSTDDRYDNDVHYIGGAVLGIDMAAWAGTMHAFASRPPRPEVVGENWKQIWAQRLDRQEPLGPTWLGHQERDAYWKRGSVCENYAGIQAAVLAVGGWADPYHDTVFRLLENLQSPRKGILGPWSHQYPDRGLAPGPGIDFLGETLRWWDRWLKDEDTGVEQDPDLRVWINDSEPPATYYQNRRGRWTGLTQWTQAPDLVAYPLQRLGTADTGYRVRLRSPLATGQDAGRFFPFGNPTDLPPDQRAEDGRSRCLDLPVDRAGLTVLGAPRVRLRLRSSGRRAHVIVRLCDVAPDGSSTLITRGVLNLTKRRGMDRAEDMTPGIWEDVTVPLVSAGYSVAAGHRLRVAISDQYWPWVWPHGEAALLEIDADASVLQLPLHEDGEGAEVQFAPARRARALPISTPEKAGRTGSSDRLIQYDVATCETLLSVDPDYGGSRIYPDGLIFTEDTRENYRIREGDPTSASAESVWELTLCNDSAVGHATRPWRAEIAARQLITADAEEFRIQNWLTVVAVDGETEPETLAERHCETRVPRTSA
ncbi:CocE/NonD family hydrolase [Nesterenkonia populi]